MLIELRDVVKDFDNGLLSKCYAQKIDSPIFSKPYYILTFVKKNRGECTLKPVHSSNAREFAKLESVANTVAEIGFKDFSVRLK